jgi:hypothetical protein
MGKCRFCGAVLQVPQRPHIVGHEDIVTSTAPATQASPTAAAPAPACGACQSPISPTEASTVCPSCGLTFHADCWAENYGCSAYGCAQVNALLPKTDFADAAPNDDSLPAPLAALVTKVAVEQPNTPHASKLPVEHALLGGSVLGLLLGAFTFGVPALLALVAVLVYLQRRRGWRVGQVPRVVLAAGILAIAGVAAGVVVSYVWWLKDAAPDVDGIGVWSLEQEEG